MAVEIKKTKTKKNTPNSNRHRHEADVFLTQTVDSVRDSQDKPGTPFILADSFQSDLLTHAKCLSSDYEDALD